jgi:hypothetical protein
VCPQVLVDVKGGREHVVRADGISSSGPQMAILEPLPSYVT